MIADEPLRRFIIITWVLVSSIIALGIISASIYYQLEHETAPMPKFLSDWGGIIIGFYFGSFTALMKDILFGVRMSVQPNDL